MTKQERVAKYKEIREQFENLVIPSDDTPVALANSLIETYNRYREWLAAEEDIAATRGYYQELVSIE